MPPDSMTQRRQAAWRAVARGARMLDARLPEWHLNLELENFNIGSGSHCVIGQLARADMEAFYIQVGKVIGTGDYAWGVAMLMDRPDLVPQGQAYPESRYHSDLRRDWAAHYGFDLDRGGITRAYDWGDLHEAWIWQIAQRRGMTLDATIKANWYSEAFYGIKRVQVPWPDGEVPAGDA